MLNAQMNPSQTGTTQNDTFGYNSRSELVSATLGNDNYSYAFDAIGNRETSSEAGTALAYATSNLNQYTGIAPSSSSLQEAGDRAEGVVEALAYDADGNATLIRTSTGTWQISYNAENRPVRFENAGTQTVVECGYDSQGRRFEKKVTVAGTTTLHHRYIYRGYLQIACVDCTRSGHPALWLVTWDPSQPTATRPLAIQKDGTWFTYGYDITKNVCEVFGPAGYIRTAYSYAPFGNVSASGDVSQPFQWSSEHYDSELDLVYYNFRHYSPSLGRFLSRDPIAEQGGLNLYGFVKNEPLVTEDLLGFNAVGPLSKFIPVIVEAIRRYGWKFAKELFKDVIPQYVFCDDVFLVGTVRTFRIKVQVERACSLHKGLQVPKWFFCKNTHGEAEGIAKLECKDNFPFFADWKFLEWESFDNPCGNAPSCEPGCCSDRCFTKAEGFDIIYGSKK